MKLSLLFGAVAANPYAHLFPEIRVTIAAFECFTCQGNSYQECQSRGQIRKSKFQPLIPLLVLFDTFFRDLSSNA